VPSTRAEIRGVSGADRIQPVGAGNLQKISDERFDARTAFDDGCEGGVMKVEDGWIKDLIERADKAVLKPTAEQLISERFEIDDKIKAANKKVAEFLAPYKARLEEIDGQLLSMLNALGTGEKANIATSVGTAYVSNLLNVSIDPEGEPYVNTSGESQVGRMALLDWALENWETYGADILMVQAQKDTVKRYMEEHEGQPPPGLKTGWFRKVNVRRS
jgi:hypothetical protein